MGWLDKKLAEERQDDVESNMRDSELQTLVVAKSASMARAVRRVNQQQFSDQNLAATTFNLQTLTQTNHVGSIAYAGQQDTISDILAVEKINSGKSSFKDQGRNTQRTAGGKSYNNQSNFTKSILSKFEERSSLNKILEETNEQSGIFSLAQEENV